jgi:hypothetical protein
MKKKVKLSILIFVLIVLFIATPCYALVKIFHFDDTLKSFFGLTDEELNDYGISSSIVNLEKEFDDATIIIKETVFDEKEIFISVSITGKNEAIYLDKAYLSNGDSFNLNDENTSFGFGLIDTVGFTNNYTLTMPLDNKMVNNDVTLRLISDKDTYYDISFILNENDMKVKETKYDTIVYNENDCIIKVKSIRLTPLHVIVDLEYNKDIDTLTIDELDDIGNKVYNDNNDDTTYVTYKDDTTTTLRLWYDESILTPYGIHGTKIDQVNDIENIKSITINNVT